MPDTKDDLQSLTMEEFQANLNSLPDGLSQAEAQNRLAQYKPNAFLQFLTYLWGPIPWMIEAAVGFWEEHQAGNAIAALKAKLALQARVRRDRRWSECAARDVVPGDVIRLRRATLSPRMHVCWLRQRTRAPLSLPIILPKRRRRRDEN
jgi:H+-transporting ATPase